MITIYKTPSCAYCVMVQKLCDNKGIDYKLVDLEENVEKRQELREKTGAMTVPITTDGKDYVVGWQPSKLMALLNAQAVVL